MEQPHRFPHRQLLGWIYLGLGIIVEVIAGTGTWLDSIPREAANQLSNAILLFLIGLVIVFSLLSLSAGLALLMNKRAARPLTLVVSWGLTVLSIGESLLTLNAYCGSGSYRPCTIGWIILAPVIWLLPLLLGIYGFFVARRIQPPYGAASHGV